MCPFAKVRGQGLTYTYAYDMSTPARGPSNEGHESWDAFLFPLPTKSLFYDNGQPLWGMFFSFLSRSRSIAAHLLIIIRSRKYPRETGGHMMIVVWTQTSKERESSPCLAFPFLAFALPLMCTMLSLSLNPFGLHSHATSCIHHDKCQIYVAPATYVVFFLPFNFLRSHTHIYIIIIDIRLFIMVHRRLPRVMT